MLNNCYPGYLVYCFLCFVSYFLSYPPISLRYFSLIPRYRIIRHPCRSCCPNTLCVRYHHFPTPFFTVTTLYIHLIPCVFRTCAPIHYFLLCTFCPIYTFTVLSVHLSLCPLSLSNNTAGSRPLFPQWSHHVYPQFLPGGHPAHRHPHTHCKLDCSQHINNNTLTHTRIASYHRAHAGNTDRPPLEC